MKSNLKHIVLSSIMVVTLIATSCNSSGKQSETTSEKETTTAEVVYTCPMHPEVEQSEQGSCPDCGMDLVKKGEEMDHSHDGHMHD